MKVHRVQIEPRMLHTALGLKRVCQKHIVLCIAMVYIELCVLFAFVRRLPLVLRATNAIGSPVAFEASANERHWMLQSPASCPCVCARMRVVAQPLRARHHISRLERVVDAAQIHGGLSWSRLVDNHG